MRNEPQSLTDNLYEHPAMMPGPDTDESHGGEDVPIYAIGMYSHT